MNDSELTTYPFISVIVLTYNSSATIHETLDSLICQEYPLMELLVCDDGSTDSTQEIVETWLTAHKHLFKRAVLLPSTVNEGICKNIEKGYAAAQGDWLKPIAGDDYLAPQALQSFAAAAAESKHDVIVSLISSFSNTIEENSLLPSSNDIKLITGPSDSLRTELLSRNPIPAPGVLLRRNSYKEIGGIDQTFKHLDDWPLWMRFTENRKTFEIIHEALVFYRVSPKSISSSRSAINVNKDYLGDLIHFYKKYQHQHISPIHRWDRFIELLRWKMAMSALRPYPRIYKATFLLKTLSPIAWLNFIRHCTVH